VYPERQSIVLPIKQYYLAEVGIALKKVQANYSLEQRFWKKITPMMKKQTS
jgi:hypothetical protein